MCTVKLNYDGEPELSARTGYVPVRFQAAVVVHALCILLLRVARSATVEPTVPVLSFGVVA